MSRIDLGDVVGRTVNRTAQHVAQRASSFNFEPLAEKMLAAVDKAAGSRWDAAVTRAGTLPGAVRPEKIAALTDAMSRELAAVGAASGAAAAAPAVGTAA